jgi:hypothetical protein
MESRRVSGQIHLYWRIRRANGRIFRVKPVALPVSGANPKALDFDWRNQKSVLSLFCVGISIALCP